MRQPYLADWSRDQNPEPKYTTNLWYEQEVHCLRCRVWSLTPSTITVVLPTQGCCEFVYTLIKTKVVNGQLKCYQCNLILPFEAAHFRADGQRNRIHLEYEWMK